MDDLFYTHSTYHTWLPMSLPSFLKEFDKKPWTVNEQIKIIHDFLDVSHSVQSIFFYFHFNLAHQLTQMISFTATRIVHYRKDGDVRTLEECVGPGV